ncbi:MAG: phosphodiester glycosidase family protein [Oscillospiraceae bacterium]|jgi:uncharacterized protein YigE (DUF2233 family)|nr:phosphodiester glycosidase family protein [Oscillospiraceae bacterium]
MSALLLCAALMAVYLPASAAAPGVTVLESREYLLGGAMPYTAQTVTHSLSGRQEERIFTLAPGSPIVPVLARSDYVYNSALTLPQAAQKLKDQGRAVVGGVNADFFSTAYMTPIGLTVDNGVIITCDNNVRALGFLPDGKAVIGAPQLSIAFTAGGVTQKIDRINRVRDVDMLFLYTSDFSETTRTTRRGKHVVMKASDRLTIGGSVACVVTSVHTGTAAVNIAQDEFVLSASTAEPIVRMDSLAPGDEVTVSVAALGGSYWEDVVTACGGLRPLLVNGGVVSGLDSDSHGASRAPRTAAGIRPDGSVVFYTVDGRQSGYSHGLSLPSVARRMLDLGCEQALELDGGGSTSAGIAEPGKDTFILTNRPSDGSPRRCVNFMMFVNTAPVTGDMAALHVYGSELLYTGASGEYAAYASDSGGHPAPAPDPALLDWAFTGTEVTASYGGIRGSLAVRYTDTLDTLAIAGPASVKPGGSAQYEASGGTYGGKPVAVKGAAFAWSADAALGAMSESGLLRGAYEAGAAGAVRASGGGASAQARVVVSTPQAITAKDFEGDENIAAPGLALSRTGKYGLAARGSGAGELAYDFGADRAGLTLPLRLVADDYPEYVYFWLKGDGSPHTLGFTAVTADGASPVAAAPLNNGEYALYSAKLPRAATGIDGLTLTYGEGAQGQSGVFWLDHITFSWLPQADAAAPALTAPQSGDGVLYTAAVSDNAGAVPKEYISVTWCGKPLDFDYDAATGALRARVPETDGALGALTVTAADAFGNYARASAYAEGAPAAPGAPEDIITHPYAMFLLYLDAAGVLDTAQGQNGKRLFEPGRLITRLELARMTAAMLGLDARAATALPSPFADTDDAAVKAGFAAGLLSGTRAPDGTLRFLPDEPISRAAVCALLYMAMPKGLPGGEPAFADIADAPAFARAAITSLHRAGLVSGGSNNRFSPQRNMTRADAALLLARLFC